MDEDTTDETGKSGKPAALLEALRIAEALVFAAEAPMDESDVARRIPEGVEIDEVMQELRRHYEGRGVNLVRVGRKWTFRTAADLGWLLSRDVQQQKKLSRAALETLAIIAYHQPTTRAEIEEIRGVAISKGTLDVLLETGWVRLRGRRKAPGRPVTYGTTDDFLLHFGLESLSDLPGLDELKGAGLFDGRLPPGFGVPTPNDSPELTEDEDPLEDGDLLALEQEPEVAAEQEETARATASDSGVDAALRDGPATAVTDSEAAAGGANAETAPVAGAENAAAGPDQDQDQDQDEAGPEMADAALEAVDEPPSGLSAERPADQAESADEDTSAASLDGDFEREDGPGARHDSERDSEDDILLPPRPANDRGGPDREGN